MSALRRVLIVADESAEWVIAGLPQLDRIALTLREFVRSDQPGEPINICVLWDPDLASPASLPPHSTTVGCDVTDCAKEFLKDETPFDLVLSTRLLFYRDCMPALLERARPAPAGFVGMDRRETWTHYRRLAQEVAQENADAQWEYVSDQNAIPDCERRFLRRAGKSQDGLVSRYLNRPLSRTLSRGLLKLPLVPSAWSLMIFTLPLCAAGAFLQGTYLSFVLGCAIFQIYSIIDGCDGEIARAKFLETEFGRRLDSLCDLIGNVLLALSLGVGLAWQQAVTGSADWLYITEGILAAVLILTSEGIVFVLRSRDDGGAAPVRWNGVLYQRHHEFVERSGILFLGEQVARWLVLLTKRDMAMLAFLVFALIGRPAWSLHLLMMVSAISSALAANAFLRQPAPALPQEAS